MVEVYSFSLLYGPIFFYAQQAELKECVKLSLE